ncbi:leucine-rich_repeat domain-containing protein [Hexamita inflata]|uniref:Leucine-rich repeat domain-containing protein n=1 Tax=Hexamita inflata TaxID=28002 RepID=A0AA86RCC3_9EUKA|nr:leucine-rich repeat domain-containing protein [Hexamita inflata]
MTEQNQFGQNQEYDAYITCKYQSKIKDGRLEIGDWLYGDQDVTNLKFIEKLNISTLILFIDKQISLKLRSNTIKELSMKKSTRMEAFNSVLYLKVDDFELENLEVLDLQCNNMSNDQLQNIAKFKKLHTLNVSFNNVDLTHIHIVTSLTKLSMRYCALSNIDQITSLVNLEDLDLSANLVIDIISLFQIQSLTKLNISDCQLKYIEGVKFPTNLEVLNLSSNQLQIIDSIGLLVNLKELNISNNKNLDITPLKSLSCLIKLFLNNCGLKSLSALKTLTNLQYLDLSSNDNIDIIELQYLTNLIYLDLKCCELVSICVLRPLVNLESLDIEFNKILNVDNHFNEMKQLQALKIQGNLISNFKQLEKHQNFNKLNRSDKQSFSISYQPSQTIFNVSDQGVPSKEELCYANKLRKIESPNIYCGVRANFDFNKCLCNNCA